MLHSTVVDFFLGSFRCILGASSACPAAAALQERVVAMERLVRLLSKLRVRRLGEDAHLHHQVKVKEFLVCVCAPLKPSFLWTWSRSLLSLCVGHVDLGPRGFCWSRGLPSCSMLVNTMVISYQLCLCISCSTLNET